VECKTAKNDFYVCQNRFKYKEADENLEQEGQDGPRTLI
jgi:hypothetical protein